jgi:GLPGLI family protein
MLYYLITKIKAMKYIVFLLILIFNNLNSSSQEKGIVYYGHIESPGMRSAAGPDLNAYLLFNNDKSYYVTAKDSLENEIKDKSLFSENNEPTAIHVGGSRTYRYGKQVFYNRIKDSLWWNQRFKGNIYIAEKRPLINWKLENETKKIGSFTAHKATGGFRGRNYTAWYILEIPVPYGPWKLQGLPGLILEAYDERKEMYLYFKSLEYPSKNKEIISQLKRLKSDSNGWQTIKDFEKMLRTSIERAHNNNIINAEKYGMKKPKKRVFSDIYIESF